MHPFVSDHLKIENPPTEDREDRKRKLMYKVSDNRITYYFRILILIIYYLTKHFKIVPDHTKCT